MDIGHMSLAAVGFFAIEALAADYVAHFLKHVGHFVGHHVYVFTLRYRVVRLRDRDIIEITLDEYEVITKTKTKTQEKAHVSPNL